MLRLVLCLQFIKVEIRIRNRLLQCNAGILLFGQHDQHSSHQFWDSSHYFHLFKMLPNPTLTLTLTLDPSATYVQLTTGAIATYS